jgi:uncharacterized repeat protein (TIGR02543 family)
MCGGSLEVNAGESVVTCEYCGTQQTLPKLDDEKRTNMYDRANHFRRNNEFDKAMAIYDQILNEDKTDAEAYWSIVLCRYGIEYVEDSSSHRRIPTVNRAQYTSILADEDYKSALANADTYQKSIYEVEAKAIDEIQKGILFISSKEEPFDVFICYKETDNNGRRTPDSVLAQELYYGLKNEGFKVFFARITLEDKLGSAYEPYIFAALNSAKVMVVLGTKPEFFNAVWVKNEWNRYLALIKQGQKKMLIPAYKDMDPYDLPEEFSHLQAQDMSKLGFMQDLIRGIKKIAGKEKKEPVKETVIVNQINQDHDISPMLKRAFLFLEDGDFDSADEYAEKILDIDPECSDAYIIKLLIDLKLRSASQIISYATPIDRNPNYIKALRFAKGDARNKIEGYNQAIVERIDLENKKQQYATACSLMNVHKYDEAIAAFSKIKTFKDSVDKIEACKQNKETDRKESIYATALRDVASSSADDKAIKKSISALETIKGYKDADAQIEKLQVRLEKWYEDKKAADERARIKAEQDKLEAARQAELRKIKVEQNKKKAIKIAKIGVPSLVALVLVVILTVTLFIPMIRFNKADKLFAAGKYDEANRIYSELDGFGDSDKRISTVKAIDQIEDKKLEDGIKTLLAAGVPVELTYQTEGGSLTETQTLMVGYTLSLDNSAALLSAETVTTISEQNVFTFNASADFTGLKISGRNGYRFIEWGLDTYAYDVEAKDAKFCLTLKATWSTKDYVVKYDLAGGSISKSNVAEYDPEDEAFTLINPTRTGYTFAGWTGTDLPGPTMEVTIPTGSYGDRNYTATWTANEYTVTYDAAGGIVSSATQTVAYDSDVEYLIPERAGYTFLGWYENTTKHENEKWTRTSDLSLMAKWEIIGYTISYEMNDGTNHEENPTSYKVDTDTITLKEPSRTGYTFTGWTYEGQSTPTKTVTIAKGTTGEKTYTANWEAISSTITLNPNGGSCDPVTVPVTYNQNFTLPTPVWEGHTFSGWYIGDTKVTSGTCKFYEDTTLVAEWDVIQYTITYTMNGGTNAGSNPTSYNYHDTFTLADPEMKGYTFLGWTYTGQTTPTKNITVVVGTTGDKSYTSNWQANTYTVTFDANGGTVTPTSNDVTFDTNVTLPTPTRTGYLFDGWFAGATQYTTGTWVTDTDVTLVAKWTANSYTVTYDDVAIKTNTITVTFDYNYSGYTATTVTLTNGQTLTYPTNPTRIGYVFTGWYTNSSCTSRYSFSGSITEDITLYAGWGAQYTGGYSHTIIDPTSYYSSSYSYRISNSTTSSSNQKYLYLVANESGTHYIYYKNGFSSSFYATYIGITNLTTGASIKSTEICYSTSYNYLSFTCNAGDIIVINLYMYYSEEYAYFYFSGFSSPEVSTATASCSDVVGLIYDTTYNHIINVTFDENITLLEPTRVGYTFGGWFYNGNKVESGAWKIAANATLTANWIKNQYTVTLNTNGGTCAEASKTVTYDSSYTLPTPTRTGYIFDGWFCGYTLYSGGTWLTPENTALVAKWTPRTDISYVVNHYQQNANDDDYVLESTENLSGTADAEITPFVKSFTHFISPTAKSVTIKPDGTLVVDYYYDRVTYDLTYVTNGGDTIEKQTYKYDQTLVIATPTRDGYTFSGWFTNKTLTTAYSATATLNADTTIYAYWAEENKPTDFTYSGTSSITISAYNGTSTTMWIPSYIGGAPVTTISASAFQNKFELLKVIVPDTVTSIGVGAFKGCNAIEDITLPFVGESISSTEYKAVFGYIFGYEISEPVWFGNYTTSDFINIPNETIQNSVWQWSYRISYDSLQRAKSYHYYIPRSIKKVHITTQTVIPTAAFNNCDFIETITIPTTVTSIGDYAFQNCNATISKK